MIRRLLITAAATLALSAGVVTAAAPAQAWTGSGDVDLVGFASCRTVPNAMDVVASATWVHVDSTGEITEQPVNYWTAYWDAHLQTIPPEGSWAELWIYCDVPGTEPGWRFVRSTFIGRPWFGWAIKQDWARA